MLCSNCGKDIPVVGKVCPWCRADKSRDQRAFGMLGALGGCLLGCYIGGLVDSTITGGGIGMLSGMFVGMATAHGVGHVGPK